jgi:hypothetical protein
MQSPGSSNAKEAPASRNASAVTGFMVAQPGLIPAKAGMPNTDPARTTRPTAMLIRDAHRENLRATASALLGRVIRNFFLAGKPETVTPFLRLQLVKVNSIFFFVATSSQCTKVGTNGEL